MGRRLIAIAALAFFAAGCATKHAGRMMPVSEAERTQLDCREIQIEQAKVGAFFDNMKRVFQMDGLSVLAFLGDFGIGNDMEQRAAQASAERRRDELLAMSEARGCGRLEKARDVR